MSPLTCGSYSSVPTDELMETGKIVIAPPSIGVAARTRFGATSTVADASSTATTAASRTLVGPWMERRIDIPLARTRHGMTAGTVIPAGGHGEVIVVLRHRSSRATLIRASGPATMDKLDGAPRIAGACGGEHHADRHLVPAARAG